MSLELSLTFPDHEHVLVSLRDGSVTRESPVQAFSPPLDAKIRSGVTSYLETYSAHYTTELDDARAAGIAARLKDWGRDLFRAALGDHDARSLFDRFRNNRKPGRVVSISTLHRRFSPSLGNCCVIRAEHSCSWRARRSRYAGA
jgi:hypothetical protein